MKTFFYLTLLVSILFAGSIASVCYASPVFTVDTKAQFVYEAQDHCVPGSTIIVEKDIGDIQNIKLCNDITLKGKSKNIALSPPVQGTAGITLLETGKNDVLKNITFKLKYDRGDIAVVPNNELSNLGTLTIKNVTVINGRFLFRLSGQQSPFHISFVNNKVVVGMGPVTNEYHAGLEISAYSNEQIYIDRLSNNVIDSDDMYEPGMLIYATSGGHIFVPKGERFNFIHTRNAYSPPIMNIAEGGQLDIKKISHNSIRNDCLGDVGNSSAGIMNKTDTGGLINIIKGVQYNTIINRGVSYSSGLLNIADHNSKIIIAGNYTNNFASTSQYSDPSYIMNTGFLNIANHSSEINFEKSHVINNEAYMLINENGETGNPEFVCQAQNNSTILFGLGSESRLAEYLKSNNKFDKPFGAADDFNPIYFRKDDTSKIS